MLILIAPARIRGERDRALRVGVLLVLGGSRAALSKLRGEVGDPVSWARRGIECHHALRWDAACRRHVRKDVGVPG